MCTSARSHNYLVYTVTNVNNGTVSEINTNESDGMQCEIFIGLTVVFMVISVITTTIIVILSWKLCNEKRTNGNLYIIYIAIASIYSLMHIFYTVYT